MNPPTCQDICDEMLQRIEHEPTGTWRHGTEYTDVYYRKEDHTYWGSCYRISTCGETHEMREGSAEIYQVWPTALVKKSFTCQKPQDMTFSNVSLIFQGQPGSGKSLAMDIADELFSGMGYKVERTAEHTLQINSGTKAA